MTDNHPTPEIEEILTSAVTRHVEEQRSLQTSLSQLTDRIDGFGEQAATTAGDVQALAGAVLDLNAVLRDRFTSLEERVGSLAATLGDGLGELAGANQHALEGLGNAVSSSLETIHSSLAETLQTSLERMDQRLDVLQGQFTEANDLMGHLRGQAADFNDILTALNEVPRRLEGVISQALRRALTVRAGLVKEAEKAIQSAMAPFESTMGQLLEELETSTQTMESVAQTMGSASGSVQTAVDALGSTTETLESAAESMTAAAGTVETSVQAIESTAEDFHVDSERESGFAEEVRRIALGQVELGSRLDDLAAVLQELEADREERDRELFEALERAGEALGADLVHPPMAKRAKPKPKPAAKKPKPAAKKPKTAAKRTVAAASQAGATKRNAKAAGQTKRAKKAASPEPSASTARKAQGRSASKTPSNAVPADAPGTERPPAGRSRRRRTYIPL